MKTLRFLKNLLAYAITRPTTSPSLIIMHKHFRDPLTLCDYAMFERSLSWFDDNFTITSLI